MKITTLQYLIWFVGPVVQVLIAYAMLSRKLVREYPIFFAYTVFHILQFPVSYVSHLYSYSVFFYVYWAGEFIDVVLVLIVVQRVFVKVLEPYQAIRRVGGTVFLWGVIVACAAAMGSVLAAPSAYTDRLVSSLLLLDRSAEIIEAGLFLLLFLFSRLFGLGWRHYLFGISLGFGVAASAGLVVDAFRNQFGPTIEPFAAPMVQIAYVLGEAVWACYFLSRTSVANVTEVPRFGQLHDWNEALAGFLGQDSRSTLVQRD